MPTPVTSPELGVPNVRFGMWYTTSGEFVHEGDRILELVTDGAVIEVTAPATGRLMDRAVWPNEHVTPGQVLGAIHSEESA